MDVLEVGELVLTMVDDCREDSVQLGRREGSVGDG